MTKSKGMSSGGKKTKKPHNFPEGKKKKKNQNNPEWNGAEYQYAGTERSRN